jgi:hypothetical protein
MGNGDMGALVTGAVKQTFHRTDQTSGWRPPKENLWAVLTRSPRLHDGRSAPRSGKALARAPRSKDGSFQSRARIHALRNRLEVEVRAREFDISLERQPVPLWDNRAARLYGSWASLTSAEDLRRVREQADKAPHTTLEWGRQGNQCWLVHRAPNHSYALLVAVGDAEVQWAASQGGCRGRVQASGQGPIRVTASLATSRDVTDPLARARELISGGEWGLTPVVAAILEPKLVRLPDKRRISGTSGSPQAPVLRSDQAVSSLDSGIRWTCAAGTARHRCPGRVMWWQSFVTNRRLLSLPSHIASPWSAEHTRGPGGGASFVHPGMGRRSSWFTGSNPQGFRRLYTMNFWWDYRSGDVNSARQVTYAAAWCPTTVGDLVSG